MEIGAAGDDEAVVLGHVFDVLGFVGFIGGVDTFNALETVLDQFADEYVQLFKIKAV